MDSLLRTSVPVDRVEVGFRLRAVDQSKVDAIKASIAEIGLQSPITVRAKPDADGWWQLVAGAHRLAAASQSGMYRIDCIISSASDVDAELWEIDENLCRADLTPADRAIFTHRRKDLYLQKHPETAHGGDRRSSAQVEHLKTKRFTAATAEATGVSDQTVRRDASRGEKISEVALRRLRGTRLDTGATLDKIKHLPAGLQEQWVEAALADEKRTLAEAKEIRDERRKNARAVRLDIISTIADKGKRTPGRMPRAAYPIMLIDVPWEQEAWSDETGQDRGLMYPSMTVDEMMALCEGDKSPATADSICGFWSTANRIAHAVHIVEHWGFEVVTCLSWDKVHIGMGRWVRDRHEILLIGKRGNFPAPLPGTQLDSVHIEAKTEHSVKPEFFADWLDRVYPGVPKIELFARRRRPGWDVWGNQAPPDDVVDDDRISGSTADFVIIDELADDDLYARAVALVRETGKPSPSLLQRRLGIGYDEASGLIDRMVAEKVLPLKRIAPARGKAVAA